MTQKEWSNMFANRVRSRLEYMSMTFTEFVTKLGVSSSKVTRWFTGESVPKATDIVNAAKVLNCKVGYLIDYGERVDK